MHTIAVAKGLFPFAKPHLKKYVVAGMLTMISASADLAAPLVLLILIDNIIPRKDPILLAKFGLAFIGLYFMRSFVDFVKGKLLITFREDVVRCMQRKLYENVQDLPVSIFDERGTGYLAGRILADTTAAGTLVGETIISALINLLVAAGTISIVSIMNWKLTLIAISVVPAFAFGVNWFNKYVRDVSRKVQEERSRVCGDIQESFAGIRLIKAFGLQKFRADKVQRSIDENRNLNIKLGILTALSATTVLLCTTFAGVLILWFGSYQVITGTLTLGQLMAFSAYTVNIFGPIRNLMGTNMSVQTSLASAERILELMNNNDSPEQGHFEIPGVKLRGDVEFRNVSFAYEPNHSVLRDVNLDVQAGNMVALVGESGAGKSTLLNLLARFYDSYDGEILIDGQDIRRIKRESLLSQFGIVLQDTFLFSTTIFENIRYGDLTATEAEIVEAAKGANAHEFIVGFPNGYQTQVGERGMKLSGGEKQRIAIARAILKNPRILILDEATSSLDSKSENLVKEALANLMRGRTTFIIAHRFSTVLSADKIIVLDGGKVAAIGSHQELYLGNRTYRRLYDEQLFAGKEERSLSGLPDGVRISKMTVNQSNNGQKMITIEI
ncbi:MAG TPA: ABC transporter ATP-binding protein [Candidatus Acidoferrales bacterium]|nr:ABC transporter ATP-binding protein [Candidatus Acidoferrales bacterium]